MGRRPIPNDIWQHANGNEYRVLFVANDSHKSEDHPEQVVYQSVRGDGHWARPLATWNERMTYVTNTHPGLAEVGLAGVYVTSRRDFPMRPSSDDVLAEVPDVGAERKHNWLQGARWAHDRWVRAFMP